MIELEYECIIFSNPITYTIRQQYSNSVFYIYNYKTQIGSIKKFNGLWEQIGGREMGDILVNDIGTFLDSI